MHTGSRNGGAGWETGSFRPGRTGQRILACAAAALLHGAAVLCGSGTAPGIPGASWAMRGQAAGAVVLYADIHAAAPAFDSWQTQPVLPALPPLPDLAFSANLQPRSALPAAPESADSLSGAPPPAPAPLAPPAWAQVQAVRGQAANDRRLRLQTLQSAAAGLAQELARLELQGTSCRVFSLADVRCDAAPAELTTTALPSDLLERLLLISHELVREGLAASPTGWRTRSGTLIVVPEAL